MIDPDRLRKVCNVTVRKHGGEHYATAWFATSLGYGKHADKNVAERQAVEALAMSMTGVLCKGTKA